MAARLLAQLVHPVTERVAVDAEAVGGLAPAAAAVEQRRERLEQPGVRRGRAEHARDERLERRSRKAEQQLERAEIVVGGNGAGDRIERGARLQQAATEAGARAWPADADPGAGRGVDELAGDCERVLFEPVATRNAARSRRAAER